MPAINNSTKPVIGANSSWQINYDRHLSSKDAKTREKATIATNAIYDQAHGRATAVDVRNAIDAVSDGTIKKDLKALSAVANLNDAWLDLSSTGSSNAGNYLAALHNAQQALHDAGDGSYTQNELNTNAQEATGATVDQEVIRMAHR